MDASAEASKEEYEERQKELEGIANPIMIMSKLYGSGWRCSWRRLPGAGGHNDDGPFVEEID